MLIFRQAPGYLQQKQGSINKSEGQMDDISVTNGLA